MTFYTIQLLRFLAALLVLFFHLGIHPAGYNGVDIFFVISGFVIFHSLFFGERPPAGRIFINRFTKIFFLYWIVLIAWFIIQPFPLTASIIKTLLLVPGHSSVIPVSWSLSYEMYFYVFTGLAVYLVPPKYQRYIFLFYCTACIAVITLVYHPLQLKGTVINFMFGKNTLEFLLGCCSVVFCRSLFLLLHARTLLLLAMISFLLLLFVKIPFALTEQYPFYGLMATCLVSALAAFEMQKRINNTLQQICKVLGDASYGMYLLGPLLALLYHTVSPLSKLLYIAGVITIAICFNQLLEGKALRVLRRAFYRLDSRLTALMSSRRKPGH